MPQSYLLQPAGLAREMSKGWLADPLSWRKKALIDATDEGMEIDAFCDARASAIMGRSQLPAPEGSQVAPVCYIIVLPSLRKEHGMGTTTIRLPEELKERVARAAERAGTTSHAFILDAIAARVDEDERRDDFHASAELRYAEIVATGRAIPWREMRMYLESRLSGEKPPRPRARKLAR